MEQLSFEVLSHIGVPAYIIVGVIILFLLSQAIGELLELFGKTSPYIFKIRKYFSYNKKRKKDKEKQYHELTSILKDVNQQQTEVKSLLNEVNMHYSTDNISMRNKWIKSVDDKMEWVNSRSEIYDSSINDIKNALSENTAILSNVIAALKANTKMTEDMFIESHRDRIIRFAEQVVDKDAIISREQFRRIQKLYKEYEEFNHSHNRKNGEVNDNMELINAAYKYRVEHHSFAENMNGYGNFKNE